MNITEISVEALAGGTSQRVSVSGTSAASTAAARPTNHPAGVAIKFVLSPDVDVFIRKGSNPTALADGTDQLLRGGAGQMYRVELMEGERLAFITGGATGVVYISPAS